MTSQITILGGMVVAIVLVPILYFRLRDLIDGRGLTVHFFDAPEDVSVLEIAYFYDTKPQFKDMIAWLIDLIFRGVVKLVRIDGKLYVEKVGVFKAKTEVEKVLWSRFFDDLQDGKMALRSVLDIYARTILMMTFDFRRSLSVKGYIYDFKKGNVWKALMLGGIVYVFGRPFVSDLPEVINLIGLFGWASFCAWITLTTPRRTDKGANLYKRLMGFRRYLLVAEKDREKFRQDLKTKVMEFEGTEFTTSDLEFSDLIPYMILLNVDKKWFETLVPELQDYVDGEDFMGCISSY